MLTSDEASPLPWQAPAVWKLGLLYRHNWVPKNVQVRFPARGKTVYDVFAGRLVTPTGTRSDQEVFQADMRAFPARLFAIASAELGAPVLRARIRNGTVHFQVEVVTMSGKPIATHVPLRVVFRGGDEAVQTQYRGTAETGHFRGRFHLPLQGGDWKLEVTELLGGRGTAIEGSAEPVRAPVVRSRPAVEVFRKGRLASLLRTARERGSLTLITDKYRSLGPGQCERMKESLEALGIPVRVEAELPKKITAGVFLAGAQFGYLRQGPSALAFADRRGLFDHPVTANIPGPGRGFVTAVFAPRGFAKRQEMDLPSLPEEAEVKEQTDPLDVKLDIKEEKSEDGKEKEKPPLPALHETGEHFIALVAGDAAGMEETVEAFVGFVEQGITPPDRGNDPATDTPESFDQKGKEVAPSRVPRLHELTGVRLDGVFLSSSGNRLLVTARGFHQNLAVIEDSGLKGRVLRAVRVGQAGRIASPFISEAGRYSGASARETARFGQAFQLFDDKGESTRFAAFGDRGTVLNQFGASSDGQWVIAPGTYGVVAWRREGEGWKEAWAIDYWREFPKLDWPTSGDDSRTPQFQVFVPHGADYALVLFAERSEAGWQSAGVTDDSWLAKLRLADGKEFWRWRVPLRRKLFFPSLHASPDGKLVVMDAAIAVGKRGEREHRFYALSDGKIAGQWKSTISPRQIVVSNSGKEAPPRIACIYEERLLQLRGPDGSVVFNEIWPNQPVGLALAPGELRLYLVDQLGKLSCLGGKGNLVWEAELGCVSSLAANENGVYAAGWDGRLRCIGPNGKERWTLDCSPSMIPEDPMGAVKASEWLPSQPLYEAQREATTSAQVPASPNLLRDTGTELTLGSATGWMSDGKIRITANDLTNGQKGETEMPWLSLDDLFWAGTADRPVWAEISFEKPRDIKALTVYENPDHPESWPAEGVVQAWSEAESRWKTAAFGLFMKGPVNTYKLNLKQVSRLRYVPWNTYYGHLYTSEIEVR